MDFSFEGLDGKRYFLSPLTLGNLRSFSQWVQFKAWSDFQRMKTLVPPDEFAAESKRLLAECGANKDVGDSVANAMNTAEGVTFLIWQSLLRNHPGISQEDVEGLIAFRDLEAVSEQLMAATGLTPQKKTTENLAT